MKNALLLSMMLWGCGREDEVGQVQESPVLSQPAGPASKVVLKDARPALVPLTAVAPPADRLAVTVTNLAPEGRLRAVAGMMSCGFWAIGSGEFSIAGGRADLDLTLEPGSTGQGFSVYLFIDVNKDGKCTDDEVRTAALPTLPAKSGVQLDMKTLGQGFGGECWLFDSP